MTQQPKYINPLQMGFFIHNTNLFNIFNSLYPQSFVANSPATQI